MPKISKQTISVILPCRNEESGIEGAIQQIRKVLKGHSYEILVADSSWDRSTDIALRNGVRVIRHNRNGYGNAYQCGLAYARGEYVLMGDPDGSYDFNDFLNILNELESGADMVIGNRYGYLANKQSMPALHWHLGNPILTGIIRFLYSAKIKDSQSGFRGIRRQAFLDMECRSTGMEFASEMIIRAQQNRLRIHEIPIHYLPRVGDSKLRPLLDGLRHLRLILGSSRGGQAIAKKYSWSNVAGARAFFSDECLK